MKSTQIFTNIELLKILKKLKAEDRKNVFHFLNDDGVNFVSMNLIRRKRNSI